MAPLCDPVVVERVPSIVEASTEELSLNEIEGKLQIPHNTQTDILVELVGACNLSLDEAAVQYDSGISEAEIRPYCVVKFGDQIIHATRKAEQAGCNPVWTLDSQSLFVLHATADDLVHKKLVVSVWGKLAATTLPFPSRNAVFLGLVRLDGAKILTHCTEERLELDLESGTGRERAVRGRLALRFRMATKADIKFVKSWNKRILTNESNSISDVVSGSQRRKVAKQESKLVLFQEDEHTTEQRHGPLAELVTEADETEVMGTSFVNAVSSVFKSTSVVDRGTGKKKILVKPCCDADRPNATTYMTPQDIKAETWQPSLRWTEAGSGSAGKVYLEILQCQDLPNVDVGEAVGNVTDSFVAAVFEDALVQTPVIDDELSPRWLPWTDRAFIFNMMHPGSTLYIGVFDYDLGPLSTHDPIGRVAVNISNLQRNTLYTLKYNLYPSSSVTDRTAQGTITIRLRIEIDDEKAALMAALRPRPKIHVNVHKEKSFNIVQYTCYGQHNNEGQFELTVLRSYINEIFDYKSRVTYSVGDAFRSLIFWRGQVKVSSIYLPVDSFLFFWAATTLIERPYLFPAFLILSVPWILLANMRCRTQHPSPWNRCSSFWDYLSILRTGKSTTKSRRIDAYEGWEEAKTLQEAWEKRIEKDQKVKEDNAAMTKKLNEIGDDTIRTAVPGSVIPIDLLARLGRYQGIIGGICRKFRSIQTVLLWEESIVSFWVTAVFLAAGIVALFLPWVFILTWTARILVYGFCGPHMMLVDFILKANAKDKKGDNILQKFQLLMDVARVRREEALKLKSLKCLRFGKYITLVPNRNLSRHYDRPLPESTARAWRKSLVISNFKETKWIPGQQLYGVMIPRPEKEAAHNRELSMKEKNRLAILEARLVALQVAAACGGGIQTFGRRILHLKDQQEEEEPDAFGYELIPCVDSMLQSANEQVPCSGSELEQLDVAAPKIELNSLAYEGMSLRRVSIAMGAQLSSFFPSIYELEVEDPPTAAALEKEEADSVDDTVQSNTLCDYDVAPEETQEEGIEIVAYDHLLTDEKHSGPTMVESDSVEVVAVTERVGDLSALYRSSDTVFVAFYRVGERDCVKSDCKKDGTKDGDEDTPVTISASPPSMYR